MLCVDATSFEEATPKSGWSRRSEPNRRNKLQGARRVRASSARPPRTSRHGLGTDELALAHVCRIGFVAFLASFGYCLFSGITDTGLLAWRSQMQRGWPGLSTENFRPIGILLTLALLT